MFFLWCHRTLLPCCLLPTVINVHDHTGHVFYQAQLTQRARSPVHSHRPCSPVLLSAHQGFRTVNRKKTCEVLVSCVVILQYHHIWNIYIYIYTIMCVYIYMCVCVCVCIYVYIYMHTYIYIFTLKFYSFFFYILLFLNFYFILEYSWFIILCYFQVYSKVIQLYIYLFFFKFFSHLGYYRISLICGI